MQIMDEYLRKIGKLGLEGDQFMVAASHGIRNAIATWYRSKYGKSPQVPLRIGMCVFHVKRCCQEQKTLLPHPQKDFLRIDKDIDKINETGYEYLQQAWEAVRLDWRNRN